MILMMMMMMSPRNKRKILKRNSKKSKTVNFYCIVDYAYRGHYVKKNAPYCSTSVVVWKRIKSTKIKEILDFYKL
jgi:hypothetical protein